MMPGDALGAKLTTYGILGTLKKRAANGKMTLEGFTTFLILGILVFLATYPEAPLS